MTSEAADVPIVTMARDNVLDPPTAVSELRRVRPIARHAYPGGELGWIVTSDKLARSVLTDDRFSSRAAFRHTPVNPMLDEGQAPDLEFPGMFVGMDPPEHTRFRRLLAGELGGRQLRRLTERMAEIAESYAASMRRAGPGVDLVAAYAVPIPAQVICELLGVPFADQDQFSRDSDTILRTDSSGDDVLTAYMSLFTYLRGLIERKQREPGDDLISALLGRDVLSFDELIGVSFMLLVAGGETTANMIGTGMYALLTQPEQLAALRADPTLIGGAIEELMRFVTIVQYGVTRLALSDVELGGEVVRAGELVTVSLAAANRDPERFPDPDRLDIGRRTSGGNVAFGHGIHQCAGQQLARAEMRIAWETLLRRFPGLRLAVPAEEIPMRRDTVIYGVEKMPVTWSDPP